MSIKQAYLIEIERETANTRAILSRIQDQHLAYKPHHKSMSMGELANHVVELHNWVSQALSKEVFNFHTDYVPAQANSIQEIIDTLDTNYDKNVELINSLTDEQWMQEWTLAAGDHVIMKMPKVGALRFILQNHLIHHRGQLTVYMRMNDIPVPGIYGPSADDKQ